MLVEQSVLDFLAEVDKNSAAPGGGSVSSLVGALGVSLTRMYGYLSIGKKKYLALDEETQKEFESCFEALTQYKDSLVHGIDLDCVAYQEVMKAYGLPKETDIEKEVRQQAIAEAMEQAIESPYRMMENALSAMRLAEKMLPYGNKNALSDIGCSILCLDAAIHGAYLNVRINLTDDESIEKWSQKADTIVNESEKIQKRVYQELLKQL
ncbi:MAG: cyclodeaminase/cyclohydrolase family protein [Erysipelotrichaceae bacterium]|nr:cyclodeaminase/cyclohydrolase family protein [Erysipelotrichaceae bacterium]